MTSGIAAAAGFRFPYLLLPFSYVVLRPEAATATVVESSG